MSGSINSGGFGANTAGLPVNPITGQPMDPATAAAAQGGLSQQVLTALAQLKQQQAQSQPQPQQQAPQAPQSNPQPQPAAFSLPSAGAQLQQGAATTPQSAVQRFQGVPGTPLAQQAPGVAQPSPGVSTPPSMAAPQASANAQPFYSAYAPNISKFESGNGTQTGNGGGAYQIEGADQKAFEAFNPQYAGVKVTDPSYQQAFYNWNGTQNTKTLASNGVNPSQPGVFYAAFSLGPTAATALAKANPNDDAATIVKSVSPTSYSGNQAFFKGTPTAGQLLTNLAGVEKTGQLGAGNFSQQQLATASQAPAQSPMSSPSFDPTGLQSTLNLPNAQPLQNQVRGGDLSNQLAAMAGATLSGHSFGDALGKGFTALANTRQDETGLQNQATQGNFANQLQSAQTKVDIAKMGAFVPIPGTQMQIPGPGGQPINIMTGRNQWGQTEQINMADGTPLKQIMQQAALTNRDNIVNAQGQNRAALQAAGGSVTAGGASITAPVTMVQPQQSSVQPPPGLGVQASGQTPSPTPQQPAAVPGAPTPQAGSPTSSNAQQPQASTSGNPDADAAAMPYLQQLDQQAAAMPAVNKGMGAKALADNLADYQKNQNQAMNANDGIVAATKAYQEASSDPGAFTQSQSFNAFNNWSTQHLGFSMFSGSTNGQLQLSQAFIKQANSGDIGELLHGAMGISRPSQMEVQMVQHAVANGTMPLPALQELLKSSVNSLNGTAAEGQLGRALWAGGKYAALPGSFQGAMSQAQTDLMAGKYPKLYQPMTPLGASSAAPNSAPGGNDPTAQSPQQAQPVNVTSAEDYAKVQPGGTYLYNGVLMTKGSQ